MPYQMIVDLWMSLAKMNLEEELGLGDERNLGNSDVVIKEIFDVASHNSLEEVVNTFDGNLSIST